MLSKLCVLLVMSVLCVLTADSPAAAQGTGTIWDGVYTAAQAARGKTTFEGTCARCHNVELTGSERGPALKGSTFLSHWEDDSLESIFNKIRDTMPPIGPNTLSEDIKIDILAYILQVNSYPTGNSDLRPTGTLLENVKIVKKGIWNGVYSAAQATRGKTTFETACIRCHGADLTGTTAPPLAGDKFLGNWETDSLNSLFVKIRDTMPPNFGTILEPEAKLEILTYILQVNKFPAGVDDLKVDSEMLDAIQIVRTAGEAAAAPNFALVQVVGCLSQGANNAWVLTNTSAPVVTKEQTSSAEALKRAEVQPLGADTFQLVSVAAFKPDLHKGHKVEAKGLLYRDPDDKRINLTSLQTVASGCGQ
ncbi:MAG TPA: cytochrome c [Vicinamibacterales bacterium]|jgi:mono/diheme cytochrome c family protein